MLALHLGGAAAARCDALLAVGTTVYVGGSFGSIGGQSRSNIAAVDLSGTPTAWTADADERVLGMVLHDSTVYAHQAPSPMPSERKAQPATVQWWLRTTQSRSLCPSISADRAKANGTARPT